MAPRRIAPERHAAEPAVLVGLTGIREDDRILASCTQRARKVHEHGATLAHLGYPDMRVPISYALHYPERADVAVPRLDLAAVGELGFEQPDLETFACLRLALEAGAAGGTAPCVLNAADEVAVAAFLDGRIEFSAIAVAIEAVLADMPALPVTHFNDLFAVDAEARRRTEERVGGLAKV